MPAATTQAELLAVAAKEYRKLRALCETTDAETAVVDDGEGVKIKDIVAHRAHWIHLYLGWYRDGVAGKEVFFPAEGYRWNDLKRYNADLRTTQASLTWAHAVASLEEAHTSLIAFIEGLDNDTLYGGPMLGANNAWTPGRWAEAAGPSHYRSAAKYIRARRRETAAQPSS